MKGWICAFVVCVIFLTACAARQAATPGDIEPPLPTPTRVEQWIEVDLEQQVARLYEGERVVGEYAVATGRGDSPDTQTHTGTFTVHNKIKEPTYLSEFDVYVSDWVGFDKEHAIGFHSLTQDKYGRVIDSRLGRPVSHGCVRVGNAAAVYNFAQIGMRVMVR